jgi:hypothetical protein
MARSNSIERFLEEIEANTRKSTIRKNRRFIAREWLIKLKIFLVRNSGKNSIEIDRKIVLLLSKEVFTIGGTTEDFQNKLYVFLDYCKANKNEEEFNHLVNLFRSTH